MKNFLEEFWLSLLIDCNINFYYSIRWKTDVVETVNEKILVIKEDIEIPEFFTLLAKDLIMHMLDINPLIRYILYEIRKHPWFNLTPFKLIPGIIIGFNKISVDDYIIHLCASYYNRDKEKVRDNVNNKFDSNSTLYYILVRKSKNRGFSFKVIYVQSCLLIILFLIIKDKIYI